MTALEINGGEAPPFLFTDRAWAKVAFLGILVSMFRLIATFHWDVTSCVLVLLARKEMAATKRPAIHLASTPGFIASES